MGPEETEGSRGGGTCTSIRGTETAGTEAATGTSTAPAIVLPTTAPAGNAAAAAGGGGGGPVCGCPSCGCSAHPPPSTWQQFGERSSTPQYTGTFLMSSWGREGGEMEHQDTYIYIYTMCVCVCVRTRERGESVYEREE